MWKPRVGWNLQPGPAGFPTGTLVGLVWWLWKDKQTAKHSGRFDCGCLDQWWIVGGPSQIRLIPDSGGGVNLSADRRQVSRFPERPVLLC